MTFILGIPHISLCHQLWTIHQLWPSRAWLPITSSVSTTNSKKHTLSHIQLYLAARVRPTVFPPSNPLHYHQYQSCSAFEQYLHALLSLDTLYITPIWERILPWTSPSISRGPEVIVLLSLPLSIQGRLIFLSQGFVIVMITKQTAYGRRCGTLFPPQVVDMSFVSILWLYSSRPPYPVVDRRIAVPALTNQHPQNCSSIASGPV